MGPVVAVVVGASRRATAAGRCRARRPTAGASRRAGSARTSRVTSGRRTGGTATADT